MSKPLPAPEGTGPFFTLHVHALDLYESTAQVPTRGPHLTIAATPAGLLRLLAATRQVSISALLMFLHHGDVTVIDNTVRVEVEGWGRDWLRERGFTSNQAQLAIADLRECGWIRTEQLRRPGGWLGRQVGVLAGSVYGSGEVYLAPERKNPTRKSTADDIPGTHTELTLDGKTDQDTNEIDPLSSLVGKTVKGSIEPWSPPASTPDGKTLTGTPDQPPVLVSSLQYLQSLTHTPTIPATHFFAALRSLASDIHTNPHKASRLLTGYLRAYKADYHTPVADLVGLPPSRDTARDLADYVLASVMDPDTARIAIPHLARAADIHIPNPDDEWLPYRWVLAALSAASSNVKNLPGYFHAAMYRNEWKTSPTTRDLIDTLIAIATAAPSLAEPHIDASDAAHLDQVLALLGTYFDAPDSQLDIWRRNHRLRGKAIARYTVGHHGLTPDDVLRNPTLVDTLTSPPLPPEDIHHLTEDTTALDTGEDSLHPLS